MISWLRRAFSKAALSVSLIPSFVSQYGWSLTERFFKLVSEGYRKNAVVYACIKALATSVAEAPMRIYNQGSDKDLPTHPVRLLLERPNPYMSEYEFWELTITCLSVTGRMPWWKQRGNDGSVVALYPLRPDRVENIYGAPMTNEPLIKGYKYQLDTAVYELPAADVLMFNYPDPGSDDGGISGGLGPLQVLAREVDADSEATTFVYSLLRNSAIPGTVITTKKELTKDDAERLKENFVAKYSRLSKGEAMVLDSDSSVTPLGFNLNQLEFPALRDVAESRIAAAFGIPPIIVGLKVGLDRSTFSNMSEARRYFAETTLSSIWRRLADQINLDLGDENLGVVGKGAYARFDTSRISSLAAARADELANVAAGFKAGVVMIDEYRTSLGLDPLPGQKGQCFLVPSLVTEVRLLDMGQPPKPIPVPPPPNPQEPQPGGDGDDGAPGGKPPPPGKPAPDDKPPVKPAKPPKSLQPAAKATQPDPRAVERRAHASMATVVGIHEPLVAGEFRALGHRVVNRYLQAVGKGLDRKDAAEEDLIGAEDDTSMATRLQLLHGDAIDAAAQDVVANLGTDFAHWRLPDSVRQDVLDKLGSRITGINEETRAQVAKVINDGNEAGDSVQTIANALQDAFDDMSVSRATTIARTESGTAYNLGTVAGYRDTGVDQVTVMDGDSDSACAAADGQVWDLAQAEDEPLEHPRCVRAFAPVVPGAESAGMRLRLVG